MFSPKQTRIIFLVKDPNGKIIKRMSIKDISKVCNVNSNTITYRLKKCGLIPRKIAPGEKVYVFLDKETSDIITHSLHKNKGNPCFECLKCPKGCSWLNERKPIEGMDVVENGESYDIRYCPEFIPDLIGYVDLTNARKENLESLVISVIRQAFNDFKEGSDDEKYEAEQFFKNNKVLSFNDMCEFIGISGINSSNFIEYIERFKLRDSKSKRNFVKYNLENR